MDKYLSILIKDNKSVLLLTNLDTYLDSVKQRIGTFLKLNKEVDNIVPLYLIKEEDVKVLSTYSIQLTFTKGDITIIEPDYQEIVPKTHSYKLFRNPSMDQILGGEYL